MDDALIKHKCSKILTLQFENSSLEASDSNMIKLLPKCYCLEWVPESYSSILIPWAFHFYWLTFVV